MGSYFLQMDFASFTHICHHSFHFSSFSIILSHVTKINDNLRGFFLQRTDYLVSVI